MCSERKEPKNNEQGEQLRVIKVLLPCVLHFPVKIEICINHSVCACVCVRSRLVEGFDGAEQCIPAGW